MVGFSAEDDARQTPKTTHYVIAQYQPEKKENDSSVASYTTVSKQKRGTVRKMHLMFVHLGMGNC